MVDLPSQLGKNPNAEQTNHITNIQQLKSKSQE